MKGCTLFLHHYSIEGIVVSFTMDKSLVILHLHDLQILATLNSSFTYLFRRRMGMGHGILHRLLLSSLCTALS